MGLNASLSHVYDAGKIRGGFFVGGPLLARFGEAMVALPGGCEIWARPIDIYVQEFRALGATVEMSDDEGSGASTVSYASRNKYKNDFRDSGGLENRGGEQITRTHEVVANIDRDLTGCVFHGEKLLGSLGGMFSKTWKPKKTKAIKGPVITRGNYQITFNLWTLLAGKVSLCLPRYTCWVAMIHLKEGEITWSKGRSWDWHQFLREDRTLENRHLNPQLQKVESMPIEIVESNRLETARVVSRSGESDEDISMEEPLDCSAKEQGLELEINSSPVDNTQLELESTDSIYRSSDDNGDLSGRSDVTDEEAKEDGDRSYVFVDGGILLMGLFRIVWDCFFWCIFSYVRVDDINDVQYFYYFVKSENKPTENPLLFWITRGPGCSVLTMGRVDI
ncbi:hypothetical protein IFM89_025310 [Coptis chinensis]|uniref:UDP-N-acetylglucosamine 1-carboxyvinyltransferase n=1 Tax=Coptis chinensis TaxID=261450 RepID=A0A835HS22_9MAGN|nr:hypothetical protein IFM89_025310 [Coptis chinensis]